MTTFMSPVYEFLDKFFVFKLFRILKQLLFILFDTDIILLRYENTKSSADVLTKLTARYLTIKVKFLKFIRKKNV